MISLLQWMVYGVTGLSGQTVQLLVEGERRPGTETVIVLLLNMEELTALDHMNLVQNVILKVVQVNL